MAIYRSDQAQVTFLTEAAAGGYIEQAQGYLDTGGDLAVLDGEHAAGKRTLTVDAAVDLVAGEFIRIGVAASPANEEVEVRRIEHVSLSGGAGTIYLDAPLAFYHPDNDTVNQVTSVTDTPLDAYINLIPGVYETVDVPDPEMAIEGRWFLGTASKRNFFAAYSGQQTYTGSIGGFVLLNGKALRFPIGKVTTTTTYVNYAQADTAGRPDNGLMLNGGATANAGSSDGTARKGDIFVPFDNYRLNGTGSTLAQNTYLLFTGTTTMPTSTAISYDTTEIRKHVGADIVSGAGDARIMRLDYPLQFDHVDDEIVLTVMTATHPGTTVATTGTIPYTHAITETVDLDSVTWHVHMRSSDEDDDKDFDRRYFGGKIGSMSISAEESGMVTASWDSVNFLGMIHNQSQAQNVSDSAIETPFYSLMQPIRSGEVQFPTTEPYYFSQGEVKLFGQSIAKIRSFSLTIANNEEPRYYVSKQLGRRRGPTEIREQRREYSCSVTLAIPDADDFNVAAHTVFNELLLEGNYGEANWNRTGKSGFEISFELIRGNVVTGFEDSILINIPDDSTPNTGGNAQGAFIRTAPHNITEDNPFQVEADILFRNMKITVQDAEHYYP